MLNPIFGGISGAKLPVDEFDLSDGVIISEDRVPSREFLEKLLFGVS